MQKVDLKEMAMGLKTWFIKRAIGPYRRRRAELNQSQWLDEWGLAEYQLRRLKSLLLHAYRTVPFYMKYFNEYGFVPGKLQDFSDLLKLPVLAKKDVLNAGRHIVSTKYPRWLTWTAHTGGTTGTPLDIVRDVWSIGNEQAFVRRQWDWAGVSNRDRCAFLTGRVIVSPDQRDGRLYRYDPVMKELILSTYHLGNRVIEQYTNAMREYGISTLVAYPSSALVLARGCKERGINLRLKAVLTSSETLSSESRAIITDAFQCPVFDFYGSAERVCYIHMCEKGAYHIVPEYGWTELLPVDEENNVYSIVATGFWNRAMPLIRYQLGDLVQTSGQACSCGRKFPVVARILGRPQEYIITPDGRQLGGALLTHVLYGARNIIESQIIQDAEDHCTLAYVRTSHFYEDDRKILERLVRAHIPGDIRVDLKEVHAIERTKNGKFRPIVNLVCGKDRN